MRNRANQGCLSPFRPCGSRGHRQDGRSSKRQLDVVFNINEGGKTGVKSIIFVGNQVYSPDKLRGLMETTEMNCLSLFKIDGRL